MIHEDIAQKGDRRSGRDRDGGIVRVVNGSDLGFKNDYGPDVLGTKTVHGKDIIVVKPRGDRRLTVIDVYGDRPLRVPALIINGDESF